MGRKECKDNTRSGTEMKNIEGQITKGIYEVPKLLLDRNKMGLHVFNFFQEYLKEQLKDKPWPSRAGYYAYKFDKKTDSYIFLWSTDSSWVSQEYLGSLKKDGYSVRLNE